MVGGVGPFRSSSCRGGYGNAKLPSYFLSSLIRIPTTTIFADDDDDGGLISSMKPSAY